MLFNSFEFALFFPLVTLFYFALRDSARVYWLLFASFVFYSVYIPAYSLILVVVILIDYSAGLLMASTDSPTRRRWYLAASLTSNLGILAVFKYFNFITTNLSLPWLLAWTLPIGLSFHTFQSMAYTIEVYKRRYPAERSLPHLALYVVFYPQLVAGPIERPGNLLRQLHLTHRFSATNLRTGLQLMFWGLFKKAAIADRLSLVVDDIFSHPADGPAVVLGALAFSFQIYCDFSGYSDIAIGAARVMGFTLATNFRRPYFADSFQDFWRRWHISLSTWFRDYVYIPLGGAQRHTAFALIAVFLLSGLWHGANWTFVIWGALHAVFRLTEWITQRKHRALVFPLVTYAWIFFRADSVSQAFHMTAELTSGWRAALHPVALLEAHGGYWNYVYAVLGVAILLLVDWAQETGQLRPRFEARPLWQRAVAYNTALLCLYSMWAKDAQQFIYFKF